MSPTRIILGLLMAGTVTACAAWRSGPAPESAYRLTASDQPEREGFLISLEALGSRSVCVSTDAWPTETGVVAFGRDMYAVRLGERRFPMLDVNPGYCVGGCHRSPQVRASPRRRIETFLPYSAFDLPAEIRDQPKSLTMTFSPWLC